MVETTGPRGGRVSLLALEGPVAVGDWLLVHSGFALERLTDAEARAALALRSGADDPDHVPNPDPTDGPAARRQET